MTDAVETMACDVAELPLGNMGREQETGTGGSLLMYLGCHLLRFIRYSMTILPSY